MRDSDTAVGTELAAEPEAEADAPLGAIADEIPHTAAAARDAKLGLWENDDVHSRFLARQILPALLLPEEIERGRVVSDLAVLFAPFGNPREELFASDPTLVFADGAMDFELSRIKHSARGVLDDRAFLVCPIRNLGLLIEINLDLEFAVPSYFLLTKEPIKSRFPLFSAFAIEAFEEGKKRSAPHTAKHFVITKHVFHGQFQFV